MKTSIQQLRYLLAIAEEGSLTAAARRLSVSQPSLSEAVREVEEDARVLIFSRGRAGVTPTAEGAELLGYARQVMEAMDAMEGRFGGRAKAKTRFAVSAQHYTFAANAFAEMVAGFPGDAYEFAFNETQTRQVLEDVRNRFSDLGVMYLSAVNEGMLGKALRDNRLEFTELFRADPCAFMSRDHPLASRGAVDADDLAPYPQLSFIQGAYESPYYSEEPLVLPAERSIKVSDRAAIVNLMIGLDGYTVSSGIFPEYLQGDAIVSVPLRDAVPMRIGYVVPQGYRLGDLGRAYVEALARYAPVDNA